ncbi:hypothetical protein D9757_012731 [Collybiopsis confluens]|uniref:DUF6534 domain-containing protein n=1 Tax=Collybiopsis confluens TaxID=2823264 RepID=A0A8H5C9N5_9AGAR|nr:hypothetical protein D9757_014268 [Collybiopsis confluens]KAF5353024.1 hypothetical protein D9757_012731 [Collybiopsis confluens]
MPATLQLPGEQLALDNTMGAMLLGILISAILYGISLVQAYYYYNHYREDAWYMKSLVGATVFLDTVHLSFIIHTMYFYLITRYYDKEQLNFMIWSVLAEAIPTGVTGALVQTFYTVRVWRRKNYQLLEPRFTGSNDLFSQQKKSFSRCMHHANSSWPNCMWHRLGHHIIADVDVPRPPEYHGTRSTDDLHFLHLTWLSGLDDIHQCTIYVRRIFFTDVIIAASLCFFLLRSKTGFRHSDTLINRLVIFIVNTGLATSICAVASLICLVASSDTLLYAPFYFCIGRLYSNSLLATLNARKGIRNGSEESSEHMMVSLSRSDAPGTPGPMSMKGQQRSQNIAIRIDTAQEYTSDHKMDHDGTTDTTDTTF